MEDPKPDLLKFCAPTDNSISNLENGEIFCQHFSAYNDPFEFWNHIYDGIPDPDNEPERFAAALKAWGMEGSSPEDENVVACFDECQDYHPPFKVMRDGVRISCFASQRDNMLMWSHYAHGLRGFCIVFDEHAVAMTEPEAYVLDVKYHDAPPVVDSFVYAIAHDQDWYHQVAIEETQARILGQGKTDEEHWIPIYEQAGAEAVDQMRDIWQQVFAVKPTDWAYERERRLLVQTHLLDTKPIRRPYPRKAVKEVIMGERMHDDYRQRMLAVLQQNHPDVPVRTARRAEGRYAILIE
jgi:hypothetical protein